MLLTSQPLRQSIAFTFTISEALSSLCIWDHMDASNNDWLSPHPMFLEVLEVIRLCSVWHRVIQPIIIWVIPGRSSPFLHRQTAKEATCITGTCHIRSGQEEFVRCGFCLEMCKPVLREKPSQFKSQAAAAPELGGRARDAATVGSYVRYPLSYFKFLWLSCNVLTFACRRGARLWIASMQVVGSIVRVIVLHLLTTASEVVLAELLAVEDA